MSTPRQVFLATVFVSLSVFSIGAFCEEWPAYRADAARTGAVSAPLTLPLHAAWVYSPPHRPSPAWPEAANNTWDLYAKGKDTVYSQSLNPDALAVEFQAARVDFDRAPQPVMAGGLVYFGSTTDDTLRAIEASTGEVIWQFTAGGPIRFAPAIDGGRAYVGSDDGWLYCLDADSGELAWKFHAAGTDEQLLGNGRMISRRPLRSGVLVSNGVAYTTAGMWPSEGVFVYAFDAGTGRVLWCNDTSNAMWMDQPHGGAYALTGVVPQGYLAASEDVLLVPTGRSAPAAYDRATGRLLYYQQAFNRLWGGSWVCVDEPNGQFFCRTDGRSNSEHMFGYSLASGDLDRDKRGPGEQMVIGPAGHYTAFEESVSCRRWRSPHAGRVHALILASDVLVAGGEGKVTAYNASTGEEVWQAAVEGEARGLAVADGRLVVATSEGHVYCFEHGVDAGARPAVVGAPAGGTPTREGAGPLPEVLALVEESRMTKGYALVIGAPDARLAEALAGRTGLHVIALLADEAKVASERARILGQADLYGSRIAVQHLADPSELPHASYFANLVVVCGDAKELSGEELYRVLRPCGGVMAFSGVEGTVLEGLLEQANVPPEDVDPRENGKVVVRGKLPGAFDWDSETTCDQRVKWPLELLWFGGPGPARMTDRHWGAPTPVAANGRYFVIGENHVIAVDAYNGCELWSRSVPNAFSLPLRLLTGMTADDESVYLTFAGITYQLDAQTGEQVKIYGDLKTAERRSLAGPQVMEIEVDEEHSGTIELRESADGLKVTLKTVDPDLAARDGWEVFFDFRPAVHRAELYGPGVFQLVVVAKAGTCRPGVGPAHPAVRVAGGPSADGSEVSLMLPWAEIRKIAGFQPPDFAMAAVLVSDNGKILSKKSVMGDGYAYVFNNGWPTFVLDASGEIPPGGPPVPVAAPGELEEQARQGKRLPFRSDDRNTEGWRGFFSRSLGGRLPARPRDETLPQSLPRTNPLTAQEQKKSYIKAYGCAGTIGSETMDFFRSGTLGFFAAGDDSGVRNFGGMKPGCGYSGGLLPALGLLISNEASSGCACSYNLKTSLAMAPVERRRNEDWAVHYTPTEMNAPLSRAAINLGAPGDRRDDGGSLWLGFPRPWSGGMRQGVEMTGFILTAPLHLEGYPGGGLYRVNADRVAIGGTDRPWVHASGYRGLKSAVLDLSFYEPVLVHPSMRCDQAPKVDGDLSDACWDGAGRVCIPKRDQYIYCWDERAPGPPGHARITAYMRHDEGSLYIAARRAARLDERGKAAPWTARTEGRDAPVWEDDSIEIYLAAHPARAKDVPPNFVHLGLSASGARYDGLWNGACDIPHLDGITMDGERGDWKDRGLPMKIFESGSCRVGWNERGLLLLGEFERDFQKGFFSKSSYPGAVFIAVDTATGDSVQLAVDARGKSCLMERYAGEDVEMAGTQPTVSEGDGVHVIEALFPWEGLGLVPEKGQTIGFTVALIPRDMKDHRATMREVAGDRTRRIGLRLSERPGEPVEMDESRQQIFIRIGEGAGWNGEWSGSVTTDRDSMTAEIAIPWSTLEALGLSRDALSVKFDKTGAVVQSMQDAARTMRDASLQDYYPPHCCPRRTGLGSWTGLRRPLGVK